MSALDPRSYAAFYLLAVLIAGFFACLWLAPRMRRPAVIWVPAAYLGVLHLVCLAGLLASIRFDAGLAQLTLFTFPFSMIVADNHFLTGFDTLSGLASNYVRYVLCFGGLNAALLALWTVSVLPPRRRRRGKSPSGRPRTLNLH